MKSVVVIAIASLLSFAGAAPARAQYVMDLGNLIAAIRTGDFGDDLERLDSANVIYVEGVARLSGISVSGGVLDASVADRWRSMIYLRSRVRLVGAAMKALERHGATLDQVIYVTATNDGSATLYVDDR